jgi:hypothetical protein
MSGRPQPPSPPWPPLAATWATLFLGPLAGALVTAANLRRLGRPDKALFALVTGLGTLSLLGAAWISGEGAGERGLGAYLLLSLGNIGLYLYLQQSDFSAWVRAHPRDTPTTLWTAASWALIGFAVTMCGLLSLLTALALAALAGGP